MPRARSHVIRVDDEIWSALEELGRDMTETTATIARKAFVAYLNAHGRPVADSKLDGRNPQGLGLRNPRYESKRRTT